MSSKDSGAAAHRPADGLNYAPSGLQFIRSVRSGLRGGGRGVGGQFSRNLVDGSNSPFLFSLQIPALSLQSRSRPNILGVISHLHKRWPS